MGEREDLDAKINRQKKQVLLSFFFSFFLKMEWLARSPGMSSQNGLSEVEWEQVTQAQRGDAVLSIVTSEWYIGPTV